MSSITAAGANIQRAMTLLAASTPERHNTVRVLFYGQSITAQEWWHEVAEDLKGRFPHADLMIENRAIGGFAAPDLIATTEYDLYPFYPDLLIFHVYGGDHMEKWEAIIRGVRARTTADILVWTHHDNGTKQYYAESEHIREIAQKYRCGLVDVEAQWQKVLAERNMEPQAFLKDEIHLNKKGCRLLAEIIKAFFVHNPKLVSAKRDGLVTEICLDDPTKVKRLDDGSVEVTFVGNRIDAIARPETGTSCLATVTVDGLKPSRIPEAFARTRPSEAPHNWMPAVKVIKSNALPVEEDWTLDFLKCAPDASTFTYKVKGSVTGEDGEGNKDQTFVSKSNRVVIEGGDNWLRVPWSLEYTKKDMPIDFSVTWKVYAMFCETLQFPSVADGATERAVALIQGIGNETHVLRLTPVMDAKIDIAGFRVYRPGLPE